MDLFERAKIKQQIVNETGYKSAIRKNITEQQVLGEDLFSKCYINADNRLMFETNILGESLLYELSGHPYEPVINVECLTNGSKSFDIHFSESFFPADKKDLFAWKSFCRYINGRILLNAYTIDFKNYSPAPNQRVAIEKCYNTWYYCVTDEKNFKNISGPFGTNTLIYILASKEQKSYFFEDIRDNWDFEKEIYIHVHHRSFDCLNGRTLRRLFTYKDGKYEICEWREGIELRNVKNEEDTRCVYGVNIETSTKMSALDGRIFDIDELFALLTIMFDTNNMDYVEARKNWFVGKTVKFHDIDCLVSSRYDKNYFRLIALSGTYEQLQCDKSFTEEHEWGAVAIPVLCHSCKKTFWIDDLDIPTGVKYEYICPECCKFRPTVV